LSVFLNERLEKEKESLLSLLSSLSLLCEFERKEEFVAGGQKEKKTKNKLRWDEMR